MEGGLNEQTPESGSTKRRSNANPKPRARKEAAPKAANEAEKPDAEFERSKEITKKIEAITADLKEGKITDKEARKKLLPTTPYGRRKKEETTPEMEAVTKEVEEGIAKAIENSPEILERRRAKERAEFDAKAIETAMSKADAEVEQERQVFQNELKIERAEREILRMKREAERHEALKKPAKERLADAAKKWNAEGKDDPTRAQNVKAKREAGRKARDEADKQKAETLTAEVKAHAAKVQEALRQNGEKNLDNLKSIWPSTEANGRWSGTKEEEDKFKPNIQKGKQKKRGFFESIRKLFS
jgi:hypothetical protein